MKSLNVIGLMMTVLLSIISGCTKAQRASGEQQAGTNSQADLTGKKALIVYLSRTNNTKAIAHMIQQQVGGKLVALELANPYPENYQAIVAQVARENETGYLPPSENQDR